MDFEREPFVKIYTTETPTVRYWGFWGTVLMEQLIKKANRAGVIELPGEKEQLGADLATAVAAVIGCGQDSVEWVRKYLPALLEHRAVEEVQGETHRYLVLTRYHEGQYSGVEPKFSKRCSYQKQRDTDQAIAAGIIKPPFWHSDYVPELEEAG